MARRTAIWADPARFGQNLSRFGQVVGGMWAGMSYDLGARWWEFSPPYSNLGRPRKIWAEFVSIWAGGGIQYGQGRSCDCCVLRGRKVVGI